jgi:hypothetical protein
MPPGEFGINYKSWTKAKLSPEFPRQAATL